MAYEFGAKISSHFKINHIVEAFIISETLLWSAWNFITPIFAIFVVTNIKQGSIEVAASAYSIHLISRVIVEILTGKFLKGSQDNDKIILTILGMILVSASYVGLSFAQTTSALFIFYIISGIGFGIASPAKNSLFSMHLDKNKESSEWGLYDAITFIGVALATVVGGVIATRYGFSPLFLLASFTNFLAIIPYLFFSEIKELIRR